jgi:hypothetical protein
MVTIGGGAEFEWVLVLFGVGYFIVISTLNPYYEEIKKQCHLEHNNDYISSKIDPLIWLGVLAALSVLVA